MKPGALQTDSASMGLDSVWVLWVPDHLTMWSSREERWTEMIFVAVNPDEDGRPAIDGLAHLQVAESRFIDHLGGADSPYLFRLLTPPDPTTADQAGSVAGLSSE